MKILLAFLYLLLSRIFFRVYCNSIGYMGPPQNMNFSQSLPSTTYPIIQGIHNIPNSFSIKEFRIFCCSFEGVNDKLNILLYRKISGDIKESQLVFFKAFNGGAVCNKQEGGGGDPCNNGPGPQPTIIPITNSTVFPAGDYLIGYQAECGGGPKCSEMRVYHCTEPEVIELYSNSSFNFPIVPNPLGVVDIDNSKPKLGFNFFINYTCNDISPFDDNVCNGVGNCESVNYCNCNSDDYTGIYCEYPKCNGVYAPSLVCSKRGSCTSPDFCECTPNTLYFGQWCELVKCNDILSNSTTVCSNLQGDCTDSDKCECKEGLYSGEWCQHSICNGTLSNDTSVCSGAGNCTSPDICECDDNYYGTYCEVRKCGNLLSNNSNVCDGNGNCTEANFCICKDGWYPGGKDGTCNKIKCNEFESIPGDQSEGCSFHGICIEFEGGTKCKCDSSYNGTKCEEEIPPDFNLLAFLDDFLKISSTIITIVAITFGLVIIGAVIFVICVRKNRVKKTRVNIMKDIELESHHEEMMEKEKNENTLILNEEILELQSVVKVNDTIKIKKCCKNSLSLIHRLGRNIVKPSFAAKHISDIIVEDTFIHLEKDCQFLILSVLDHLFSLVLLFHAEKTFDFKFQDKLNKALRDINKGYKKEKDYRLEFQTNCIIEAIKLLNVKRNDLSNIINSIFNVQMTMQMIETLNEEIQKVPNEWYQRLLFLRRISFLANTEKEYLKTLLQILEDEEKQFKQSWKFILGEIYTIFNVMKISDNEDIKKLSFNGYGNDNGLSRFISFENSKKKINRIVRNLILDILSEIVKESKDQEVIKRIKRKIVKRTVLETEKNIRAKVMKFKDKVIVNYESLIKNESKEILNDLNKKWVDLEYKEMMVRKSEEEIKDKEKLINKMKEENEIRKESISNLKMEKIESEKENYTSELFQVEKQMNFLNDIANPSKNDKKKEKDLRRRKLELEDLIAVVELKLTKPEKLKAKVFEKELEINKLLLEVDKQKNELSENKENVTDLKSSYGIASKNFKQIKEDYQLALKLQEEEIKEKNQRLETKRLGGKTDDVISVEICEEKEEYDEEIPSRFLDPITLEIMTNPVILVEVFQTYEKSQIERWLKDNDTDPVTNTKLTSKKFGPNYALKTTIEEWKEKHRIKTAY